MNSVSSSTRSPNQVALRRLRSTIDANYPKGRFVAIGDDRILGDAGSFEELTSQLHAMGRNPKQSLIVQVGHILPEHITILLQGCK